MARSALAVLCLAAGAFADTTDPIAGYTSATSVVSHSQIDLDMEEIASYAGDYDFANAKLMYESGGNSVKGSGAIRTLKGFATSGAAKMTAWELFPVYSAYWGDDNYADTFVQQAFDMKTSAGSCYSMTTHQTTCDVAEADCVSPDYWYAPGYVSAAEYGGCCHCVAGCDHTAEVGTGCPTAWEDSMAAEIIKKGIAYQGDWMYVIHEFEDAVADCNNGDIYANDASTEAGDAPHAWDEGWAFYAGSLTSTDGLTNNGKLLWELANKRCADFGTCLAGTSGTAMANSLALKYAEIGRDKILAAECDSARDELDLIVQQMTVPLIQGMLKYAFKADSANSEGSCSDGDCPKEWAEGWAFAAAVLPQIDACDSTVAATVVTNLDVANDAPMTDGFAALKTAVESTYACLGISCGDVGAFQSTAGVYTGMSACTDAIAPIAGYIAATSVVPHSMIDLDMEEISSYAGSYDFDSAMFVYENGGGGLCSSWDIAAAAAATAESMPCYGHTTADAEGNSVKGSGSIRTLKGFATSGAAKMTAWELFPVYSAYWGDDNYADTFVQNAYADTTMGDAMKAELIKKGIAYQADWMYVVHEFEDAIADCNNGDIYANDASTEAGDAPHAWDEGWAFYAGSLTGEAGASNGKLLWELANKRCADFGTCDDDGKAAANTKALLNANLGRDKILAAKCDSARDMLNIIVQQMTVPVVQGMLKYAFKADPANGEGSCTDGDCPKEWAEGWAFAAAVLPQIDACDSTVAATVVTNLDVANDAPMTGGFAALKTAVESTYACLGITCADVGAFQSTSGVYTGMAACADAADDDDPPAAAYAQGSMEVTGLTVDEAEAEVEVFKTAIGASAGVTPDNVACVFSAHDHGRRLADHIGVEIVYTITTDADAVAAVVASMAAVTTSQFELVLTAAASSLGATDTFATVEVEAMDDPAEVAPSAEGAASAGVGALALAAAVVAML